VKKDKRTLDMEMNKIHQVKNIHEDRDEEEGRQKKRKQQVTCKEIGS